MGDDNDDSDYSQQNSSIRTENVLIFFVIIVIGKSFY